MVAKKVVLLLFLTTVISCVDPYQFRIEDNGPAIVIEGIITDKSYAASLTFPSDGRFFTVRLSLTGDVTNIRPQPLRDAIVQLETEEDIYVYIETNPGVYELTDPSFKAMPDKQYRLVVKNAEEVITSDWERLPLNEARGMGTIDFVETEKPKYVVEAGETVIRKKLGVQVQVHVPENSARKTFYYRWSYSPTWVYRAPLSFVTDPGHVCWVTSRTYLADYALQLDKTGGYNKKLFFFETIRNERIFEGFSALVSQLTLNEDYFYFLQEMKDQAESGGITGKPPFNLSTNFTSNSGHRVIGFFSVANESSVRWYFDRNKLSYNVENTLKGDCLVDYNGPPAPSCLDCRSYDSGSPSTTRPIWWTD